MNQQKQQKSAPVNTERIQLSAELELLSLKIAENIHDIWMRRRLEEGWVHGPVRDDKARTHPCLVPFAELPQTERDYDRATAAETMRALIANGYEICKVQR